MSKIVIGIDPDAEAHGVAIYADGELVELMMADDVKIINDLIPKLSELNTVSFGIENVLLSKCVHAGNLVRSSRVNSQIARKIGMNQQSQIALMRWLDISGCSYMLYKPSSESKIWKESEEKFKAATGWKGRSNRDTRSAAYFGWRAVRDMRSV